MNDPGSDDQAPLAIDERPYLQVTDRLEDRIRRGEFGADGKLPGTADLADWYGVGRGVAAGPGGRQAVPAVSWRRAGRLLASRAGRLRAVALLGAARPTRRKPLP